MDATGQEVTYTFTDSGSTPGDAYFMAGKLNFGSDIRLITGNVPYNVLSLHVPMSGDFGVGSEFTISPGCDGHPNTCKLKYNNLLNFNGMPYIPSNNPVIWGFR